MWRRWIRNLTIELDWMKLGIIRRWRLDTPTGVLGTIILISGVLFFIIIGTGIARIFRSFVPWVDGTRVGEVYWQSLSFGFKASILLLIFGGALMAYLFLKFTDRR